MSYTIGDKRDNGYCYTVEANGLITKGWRVGTKDQVEHYVKKMHRKHMERIDGTISNYGRGYRR